MSQTHQIKTWKPQFQDILDGKKPFDFRYNDRGYKVGDDIVHLEFDQDTQTKTGRECHATIVYLLGGGQFGIPDGYVIFTQLTTMQRDYIRDYERLANVVLPEYEKKLSYKVAGNLTDRIDHVLRSLNGTATEAIFKAKNFVDDVKTQFKALEIVMEGITGHGNHTEKRVLANHVISMLRSMIDRVDQFEWDYTGGMHDHFNFFRSQSPEGNLVRKYKELKNSHERLQEELNEMKGVASDKSKSQDLPF